ncbi:MAG: gamma carbonic anhydrase family protein [Gammaproteobacteria bacterium]|nr:gamma carbonic anhydrase family protein [Gammaproteobacteria bacterium]
MIYTLQDRPAPEIAESSYIADSADIIGWVSIGEESSIWFNAVLRGDNELIRIGNRSNVQDCSVMHTDPGFPIEIEGDVTVGHSTMLHGCKVGRGSLIGIGSVILNNAVIGQDCLVGAGSLITENRSFPDRTLILGSPAKAVRELRDEEIHGLRIASQSYVNKIPRYRKGIITSPNHCL